MEQRGIKKLPGYLRIEKQRERLRKRGKSEEQIREYIEGMLKQEYEQFKDEYPDFLRQQTERYTFEFSFRKDAIRRTQNLIAEYTKRLPPQAHEQKGLGNFLHELKGDEIIKYIREKTLNVKAISQDSKMPLRTVERFLEGLRRFSKQKQ